jgi:hypothetical protein
MCGMELFLLLHVNLVLHRVLVPTVPFLMHVHYVMQIDTSCAVITVEVKQNKNQIRCETSALCQPLVALLHRATK